MQTYMRSESFKSSSSGEPSKQRPIGARPGTTSDEEEIPPSPPAPLRGAYLKTSWSYVYWCAGMLVWCVLCCVYFVMTQQTTNLIIGITLAALLVAMIVLPTMLFGGHTWYKRLGWMMLLLGLFSAMWIYPIVMIGWGIRKRIADERYHHLSREDWWHTALSALTVIVATWTLGVTWRCGRLVKKLYRGEFGVTEIRVKKN
jgi:hypothetical protein